MALAGTIVLTPGARRVAIALNIVDRPAERKFHRESTPYLGGAAIIIGIILANALSGRQLPLLGWQILGLALLVAIVGLWDDYRPMGWRPKLAVETIAAVAAAGAAWGALPKDDRGAWELAALALGVGGIVLMTNSFNLLDNIDAHSSSVALASNAALALVALSQVQQRDFAPLPLTVAAGCAGFLVFNLSKRFKIFLGDSGSLMLGFVTAASAVVLLVQLTPEVFVVAALLLFLVPGLDTLTVVVDRRRHGISIFTPGKDHLSHRLVRLGLTPRQSVAALATLQAASGAAAYAFVSVSGVIKWVPAALVFGAGLALFVSVLRISGLYAPSATAETR